MIFRTETEKNNNGFSISYNDRILMIGSCFTENIGNWLKESLFDVRFNPSGIMYNPVSVGDTLMNIIEKKAFTDKELFFRNGTYNSFFYHSRHSDTDKEVMLENINNEILQQHDRLKTTDYLFITFGTSWIYSLNINAGELLDCMNTGDNENCEPVVGNCHKLSDKMFTRRRLSVSEIISQWNSLIKRLKEINPGMRIIFTVSPIRHIKDTLHGNQLSKATLLLAIDEICAANPDTGYFPAYEILIDDLRDYRFYSTDMLHPSESAIEYIREKFSDFYFGNETRNLLKECMKISRALAHRPKNPNTPEYLEFLTQNIFKFESLIKKYDYFSFHIPLEEFQRRKQELSAI